MTIFIPNGIITREECVECREPHIKVEHGKDTYNLPMHFEHCPNCGDAMLILCFDCLDCKHCFDGREWNETHIPTREPSNSLAGPEKGPVQAAN